MIDPNARIDLHTHSTCSDGRATPTQVMREAKEANLDYVALTDHDSTKGWVEAEIAADELGLKLVPGIEVTSRAIIAHPDGSVSKFSVHMLAYLPNAENPGLKQMLEDSVNLRVERLKAITELLAQDYDVDWDAVLEALPPGATAGRPAVADAMINRGIFEKRDEFFKLVYPGSKYYVPNRGVPTPEVAIATIRAAGGVPIIAHPMARGHGPNPGDQMPRTHFLAMIEAGLAGFEVEHRDVPEHVREWLQQLAFEFDLITTGSSDYHGTGKENRLGENLTKPAMLERIYAQAN